MPPGWLKKRGSLRDVENVSTRKLSVRLKKAENTFYSKRTYSIVREHTYI